MKIALYYPWVFLTSGAERSILELTGKSRHEWTIFTNRFEKENTYPEFQDRKVVELSPRISVERSFTDVIKASYTIMKQKLPLEGYDALFVICEGVGDFITVKNNQLPTICICLTPLRPVFDLCYREVFLQDKSWYTAMQLKVFGALFKTVDKFLWKKYDHVFCISKEVRNRVVAGVLYPENRMDIIYPGINSNEFKAEKEHDYYFLLPGRIKWTKNIELGIEAFKIFLAAKKENKRFHLIITGMVDSRSGDYFEKLQDLAKNHKEIEFICRPSDEELFALYRRSYCVLFTAFNEDWGMVPLEGMSCGKPVVAVNRGGPRESVKDGITGLLTPPEPEKFALAMRKIGEDPAYARQLGDAGRDYCSKFDWTHFVEPVDQYIDNNIKTESLNEIIKE